MNIKSLTALAVFPLLALTSCTDPAIEAKKNAEAKLEQQRHSIRKAIDYDHYVAGKTRNRTLITALFGTNAAEKANYIKVLKQVPLENTPKDFQDAYHSHIAAWEADSQPRVNSTWAEVLAAAARYDVRRQ